MAAQPLHTVFGNVVLTGSGGVGDAWAVFSVATRSYQTAAAAEKQALVAELEQFCREVGADLQILRVSRRWDVDAYLHGLATHHPRPTHREEWERYLDAHHALLDGQEPGKPLVFVCVRLAEPSMDITARASRVFDRSPAEWLQRARELLDLRPAGTLDRRQLSRVYDRAALAEQRVADWLDARPARVDEIEWLVRRSYTRGLGEPSIEGVTEPQALTYQTGQRPTVLPQEGMLLRWTADTEVRRMSRCLQVTSELGTGYQAGLCVGQLGHAEAFTPAAELMFGPLEDVPFPVDACVNLRYVPNDQAVRLAAAQIAKTSNDAEEENRGPQGATDPAFARIDLARELHARLVDSGDPLLRGTLSLIFGARDERELTRRRELLRASFSPPLHQPVGDQLEVFLQHFPGQSARTVGYDQAFTPEQLGAMAPHATHQIGSETDAAIYLGETIHGRQPVRFDLREASDTNTSPTIAMLGSQGGGKTTTSLLLLYQAFLQGARIVDIDPKGDHRFHQLPDVAPHCRAITLGPDPRFRGMLDPLRVAPADERIEAGVAFMVDMLPQPVHAVHQTAIVEATKQVVDQLGARACCLAVIDQLRAGDADAQMAARQLGTYSDLGLAQLGFAAVEQPLPSTSTEQVTYLQVRALPRPQPGTPRSELGSDERVGRAVLRLLALYAMRILGEDRTRLKVMSFDEAHFLYEDSVGHRLMSTISRWGRAELAVPIFSTQLIGDIKDADNLIGHWFFFGMRSRTEAANALRLAQLDPEDERLLDNLTNYADGRCLYRDLHGRTEEIQVDLVLPELLEGISTTPEKDPALSA